MHQNVTPNLNQVIELREKGLSTKVIALANAAWIRYMTGKGPIWGDAILGVIYSSYAVIYVFAALGLVLIARTGRFMSQSYKSRFGVVFSPLRERKVLGGVRLSKAVVNLLKDARFWFWPRLRREKIEGAPCVPPCPYEANAILDKIR